MKNTLGLLSRGTVHEKYFLPNFLESKIGGIQCYIVLFTIRAVFIQVKGKSVLSEILTSLQ